MMADIEGTLRKVVAGEASVQDAQAVLAEVDAQRERNKKLLTLTIYHSDADNPCEGAPGEGGSGWVHQSFHRHAIAKEVNGRSLQDREYLNSIGFKSKLKAGLAFMLDVYSHSGEHWSLSGTRAYPDEQWDVARGGGVLVWAGKPNEMGAKTYKDRKKDAQGALDEYNEWVNGSVYGYSLEDANDGRVDSCGGFIGWDNFCEYLRTEVIKPGDKVVRVIDKTGGMAEHLKGIEVTKP